MNSKTLEYALYDFYDHQGSRDLRDRIEELKADQRALYDPLGSPAITGMPHNPSPSDTIMNAIERIGDKPETIAAEIEQKKRELREIVERDSMIEAALLRLKHFDKKIIRLRHRDGMDWLDISKRIHLSERWLRERYYAALRDILKEMD